METIEKKELELPNGETLAYRMRKGGDQIALLVHGNMNSSINWDLLMENMDENFTIYAPDLRGFGDSSYFTPIESIRDLSEDLKHFADALKLDEFHIVGWSLGGVVTMRFLLDHQKRVDRAVLLSTGSVKGFPVKKRTFFGLKESNEFINDLESMQAFVKPIEKMKQKNRRFMIKWMMKKSLYSEEKPDKERFDAYIDAMIKQRNLADVNLALARFNIDTGSNGLVEGTDEAGRINKPTLIIHGDVDKVVSVQEAHDTKTAIGDNAMLNILPNVGHAALVDDLDDTVRKIQEFLQGKELLQF